MCKNDQENINTSSEQNAEFLNVSEVVTYSCAVLLTARIVYNKELGESGHMQFIQYCRYSQLRYVFGLGGNKSTCVTALENIS